MLIAKQLDLKSGDCSCNHCLRHHRFVAFRRIAHPLVSKASRFARASRAEPTTFMEDRAAKALSLIANQMEPKGLWSMPTVFRHFMVL
jgi:hypothetical protein